MPASPATAEPSLQPATPRYNFAVTFYEGETVLSEDHEGEAVEFSRFADGDVVIWDKAPRPLSVVASLEGSTTTPPVVYAAGTWISVVPQLLLPCGEGHDGEYAAGEDTDNG